MSNNAPTILLVDDDETLRRRLAMAMTARGYASIEAATGSGALSLVARASVDFAVIDLRLPDMSGLEVVRGIKAASPATRVVVLTGYGSIATAIAALRIGASDYLSKPVDADDVSRALVGATERDAPVQDPPSLARVEWEHINRVLMDCDGNVTATARALNIHRRSLQRKLAKFPMPR